MKAKSDYQSEFSTFSHTFLLIIHKLPKHPWFMKGTEVFKKKKKGNILSQKKKKDEMWFLISVDGINQGRTKDVAAKDHSMHNNDSKETRWKL